MTVIPMQKTWCTARELAQELGITEDMVGRWARSLRFIAVASKPRPGRSRILRQHHIDALREVHAMRSSGISLKAALQTIRDRRRDERVELRVADRLRRLATRVG